MLTEAQQLQVARHDHKPHQMNLCAVVCLLALATRLPTEARTFHVSATIGDDGNNGLSHDQAYAPWSALSRTCAEVGDTLKVLPGQYFVAPLSIDDLGSTADKPLWILAEPRGAATLSAAWEEAATGPESGRPGQSPSADDWVRW